MRKISAVLFDLDDTLHDDTAAFQSAAEEVAQEIAAEHGIDALALKDAYMAEAEGFWQRLTADQLREKLATYRVGMWRTALAKMQIWDDGTLAERSADRYNRYRAKRLVPFPGALDFLRDLRAKRIKLGLLTNGFAETHRQKISLLHLSEAFDAIFIADEIGMVKPDPLLFAHACRKLDAVPAETAMVGDRYDRDIRGALTAGLFTVWMNMHHAKLPPGAPPPDLTVETLDEVRTAFATLLRKE